MFKRKKNDDDIAGNKNASFIKGERAGKAKGKAPYDFEEGDHLLKYFLGWISGFNEDECDDWKGWWK